MNAAEFAKVLDTLKCNKGKPSGGFSFRRTLKALQRFNKIKLTLDYQEQLLNTIKDRRG